MPSVETLVPNADICSALFGIEVCRLDTFEEIVSVSLPTHDFVGVGMIIVRTMEHAYLKLDLVFVEGQLAERGQTCFIAVVQLQFAQFYELVVPYVRHGLAHILHAAQEGLAT